MAIPVLEAQDLRRSYGDVVAVERLSVRVDPGEVVVLVGPNGCGKTTSVEMAIGLRRSAGGSSRVVGHDVWSERKAVARLLGVQLQGAYLHQRIRLREQVDYLTALYGGRGDLWGVLRDLGLTGVANSQFGSLSGGMQRRALVAMAFAGLPRMVVLDEPTTGVDVESRNEIWSAIRSLLVPRGAGVLVTTHDLREAESYGDRVLVMRRGVVIAEGAPGELLARSGLRSVVTLRSATPINGDLPPSPPGHVVLRSSPFELTMGFPRVKDAAEYRERVKQGRSAVTLTERRPSFEDAYLAMGVGDDAAEGEAR